MLRTLTMGEAIPPAHWSGARSANAHGQDAGADGLVLPVGKRLYLPKGEKRRFIVSVDTEEEFDWAAPFDRKATGTSNIRALPEATTRFNSLGAKPVYLCDWPVIDNAYSAPIIHQLSQGDGCEIGAHLHPWVTPPHEEAVTHRNSFAGNLPDDLQWQKLKALTERLEFVLGKKPIVFRAGRYGLGWSTHAMLAALGYRFDLSVRPRYNYTDEHGPDYRKYPNWPWRTPEGLIEIPLSTAQIGLLRKFPRLKLPGMSRLGLQALCNLSPEGIPADEALEVIRILAGEGLEIFSLSFHSPSATPGHTAFVRDSLDLKAFWDWWDKVLSHLAKLDIIGATHGELLTLWESAEQC